jgi:Fe2+ or Zn2+ uptake regulation protein
MTVEREHGGYSICCDHCSDYVEVDSPDHDWNDVREAISREGYKAEQVRGVWEHSCPACQEKGTQDGGGMPNATW